MLSNIRIVLVAPSHPGNIGATARAMKNMCLKDLYLVSPEKFPHADASSRAVGADDILTSAVVTESLPEALAECQLVFGASARQRSLSCPQSEPADAAVEILRSSACGKVAVIFGRERTGLTNEELQHCHQLVHIPCNPDYSSLNLAAAVQVISYEIYRSQLQSLQQQPDQSKVLTGDDALASQDQMEGFYNHLQQVMVDTEFLDPAAPKRLMQRIRRLFNRAQPDLREVNILRGILTAVEKKTK